MCDNFEKILPGSGWQSRAGWVLAVVVFLKNLTVGTCEIFQIAAAPEHIKNSARFGSTETRQIQTG